MSHYQLLEIMAIGFSLALFFGYITQKIGLSSIVGYLLAGFFIGANTHIIPFEADPNLASQLSEAGVILLMFAVGLHFKMEDLISVKGVAIPGAIVQSFAAIVVGTTVGLCLGMDLKSALILGFGLSVASTVVLLKVLTDNNNLNTIQGYVAVGWLVVEDIFTVIILVILPSFSMILANISSAAGSLEILKTVGIALIKIGILWVLVMKGGGKIIPFLLGKIAQTRSSELFTISVLVIAFATATIAAIVFQTSFALGAFLGGMVVGKSKLSHQAGADMLPLKDAFAVLFFLSVGMLFDYKFLMQYPWLIVSCLAIVLIVKPLVAMITVSLLGYSVRTALTVATGLSQVGEFSFILAQEAKNLGLAGDSVYNAIVVCAIISITLNPSIFKKVPAIEQFLRSKKILWNVLNYVADKKSKNNEKNEQLVKNYVAEEKCQNRKIAIVVGYGPTGKQVVETLKNYDVMPIIIEMNIDTINSLLEQGEFAVYGDSTKKNVLEAATVRKADYLIVTLPVLNMTSEIALLASSINPNLKIFARVRFVNHKEHLKQIGVIGIAVEEEEVSKQLTSLLLTDLEEETLKIVSKEIANETKIT
jgi:CPA2 family monovalent cation:H+ antiporter-2